MKKATVFLAAVILTISGCSREVSPDPIVGTVVETQPIAETMTEAETTPEETVIVPFPETSESALEEPASEAVVEKKQKLILATDIHYLAESLTDRKSGFRYMVEHGDGKLVNYVWEITDAFISEVLEERPRILILSGDLSLNGEKLSHEELAGKLYQIEEAGIPVVVIPGNHDINTERPSAYAEEGRIPAERTTPQEFEQIYGDFGYKEALSRDAYSLSYVYQLDDQTRLLMLDTCQYDSGVMKVGGMIEPETYQWIELQLEDAWVEGIQVIPVGHHNILEESQVYVENCTIEHAEELEEMLNRWDVNCYFSGHLHVQHYKSSREFQLDEVVTASLSTAPCYYGVIEYEEDGGFSYETKSVDVERWAAQTGSTDQNLLNFNTYSVDFLEEIFFNEAYESLKHKGINKSDKTVMAELYARLNSYSVAGRAMEIKDEIMEDPSYIMWQERDSSSILFLYMEEILRDAVCDYNTFVKE